MKVDWYLLGFILTMSFAFFLMYSNVLAVEYTQECINSTHLKITGEWTICEGNNCTAWNVSQPTIACVDGCDERVNQCKYVRKSESGDVVVFGAVSFSTIMFFFLGMRVQPAREFSMLKNGMQTLFFLVGFWLLLLTVGMADAVAISAGLSEGVTNLIETNLVVLTNVIYIVMVLLFLSYIISALWLLLPWGKK